jgi:alkylhydroperoxidase/carboxymuconolactone decarboxylase family protein YurZ
MKRYDALVARHPRLGQAHDLIAAVAEGAGPLDAPTRALLKLAMAVGAGLESGVRRHARGAAAAGASAAAIEQTLLLGLTTLGFPRTLWALKVARPRRSHPQSQPRRRNT